MPKIKLLWVSDNPRYAHVGQSRVTRELCDRLKDHFDVSIAGFGKAESCQNLVDYSLPIFPIERLNKDSLDKVIGDVKPDIMLLSHDCWLFPFLPELKAKHKVKMIGYFTIDGEPLYPAWDNVFNACDLIISPTQYGVDVISNRLLNVRTSVVPYGVSELFYMEHTKEDLKKSIVLQETNANLSDKFVAVSYGHNQSKKNWGAARDGWKIFAKDKTDVMYVLILHSFIMGDGETKRLGFYDPSSFLSHNIQFIERIINDNDIVCIVGAADVLLFPTVGEGFGLPVLEAMAGGTVPIVTNFSGVTDFINFSNSLRLSWTPMIGDYNTVRAIVDPKDIAKKLEAAYKMWKMQKNNEGSWGIYTRKCVDTAKKYTWEKSGKLMKKCIMSVIGDKNERFVLREI